MPSHSVASGSPAGEAPVDLLASPVRRALVETIANSAQADPDFQGLTAAELADAHGLHSTTVRFHLDRLLAAGILEAHVERPDRVGRPRKLFTIANNAIRTSTASESRAHKILAGLLATAFAEMAAGTMTPADAGRDWARRHVIPSQAGPARSPGQWLSKLGRMIDVLRSWGYTPEVSTGNDGREVAVALVNCPFIDLARDNPAVICDIHRGLIVGTMAQLGEQDVSISLEPFVGPNRCLAHLRTATPFTIPGADETAD